MQKQKPIVRDGAYSMKGTKEFALPRGGPLFFESGHPFVQAPHRVFESCHRPDKRAERYLHIVKICAHQIEDIDDALKVRVDLGFETIETPSD
jgi:hypothetical protein